MSDVVVPVWAEAKAGEPYNVIRLSLQIIFQKMNAAGRVLGATSTQNLTSSFSSKLCYIARV